MFRTILFICTLLISSNAHAMCKKFAQDLNGRLISARCGTKDLKFTCGHQRAWDGKNCVKIPIVEHCKKQGGEWKNTQFCYNQNQSVFLDVCHCPANKSWNGRNCTEISPNNQCFSCNQDCVNIHIGLIKYKVKNTPILSCERFASCRK